jgi:hypothetical protein
VTWRKGKGAIGRCWADDDEVLVNVEGELQSLTRDEFEALPRSDRYAMTWRELNATRTYSAIIATPLHGGPPGAPAFRGCLSIDVRAPGSYPVLVSAWTANSADYAAILSVCDAAFADEDGR